MLGRMDVKSCSQRREYTEWREFQGRSGVITKNKFAAVAADSPHQLRGLALIITPPTNSLNLGLGHTVVLVCCIDTRFSRSIFIHILPAMSKFGVVVMGPAGAGKVCALTAVCIICTEHNSRPHFAPP